MIRPVVWLLTVVGLTVEAVLAVWDFVRWLCDPLRNQRRRGN